MKKIFTRSPGKNTIVPDEKAKQDVPAGLMMKCEGCGQIHYYKDLEKNLFVCPKCDHHHQFHARKRIDSVFDEDSFTEWDTELQSTNPLQFPDYVEKLEADMKRTELSEAIVTGRGKIDGHDAAIAVMDSRFRMGSMGSVVGEKIARAVERAREAGIPFIIFTASGGARMQEGVLSLMQMAKTSVAIKRFSDAGGLFISVMTHPTTGGVTASFASIGDYNFAEPGALIGFAGRRVIEQTTREKLPSDFQTAEFVFKHGQLDRIIHRHEMKQILTTVIKIQAPTTSLNESANSNEGGQ